MFIIALLTVLQTNNGLGAFNRTNPTIYTNIYNTYVYYLNNKSMSFGLSHGVGTSIGTNVKKFRRQAQKNPSRC